MTEKELRRLKRGDLLEMLLEQTREVERLQAELEETRKRLEDRRIMEMRSGSIAQAALELNKVFEAAQQAADQYLENVRLHADKISADKAETTGEIETETKAEIETEIETEIEIMYDEA